MTILCDKCQAPVRPIVALDVDGTLADYHGHFIRFALQWLRRPWSVRYVVENFHDTNDLAKALNIDKGLYHTIKLAYRQGGQKRFQPPMGKVDQLVGRLRVMGFDVWITTTRPYNRFDSTDPDTREWLEHHLGGLGWKGLIYDEDKYRILCETVGCERIAFIVDDLRANCQRATDLGLEAYQFINDYNRGDLWDGPKVGSYEQVLQVAEHHRG